MPFYDFFRKYCFNFATPPQRVSVQQFSFYLSSEGEAQGCCSHSLNRNLNDKTTMIEIGLKHISEMTVTDQVTAIAMGSGDMAVLATPAMMALMENAAMLAVAPELPDGCTTVGGHIESSHLRPTAVGQRVTAIAEVTRIEGKKIEFAVSAYAGDTLIGEGTHLRFVVDRDRFMSRLG